MAVTVSNVRGGSGEYVVTFTANEVTVAVLAKVLRRLAVPVGDPDGLITDHIRDLRDALKGVVDQDGIGPFYGEIQTAPSNSGKGLRLDLVD